MQLDLNRVLTTDEVKAIAKQKGISVTPLGLRRLFFGFEVEDNQNIKRGNHVIAWDCDVEQYRVCRVTHVKPIYDGEQLVRVAGPRYTWRIDHWIKL